VHYLDYAATAPVLPEVREAMLPFLEDRWGNPSSIYSTGREARKGIDEAREKLAFAIGSAPEEVVFTGSGTEADNLAVKGTAWAREEKGKHILLPKLEHHAVLDAAEWLGTRGFEIEQACCRVACLSRVRQNGSGGHRPCRQANRSKSNSGDATKRCQCWGCYICLAGVRCGVRPPCGLCSQTAC
jgi:cysteine sulfinate desulfinase/cysteine desulfurase-like protein